MAWLLQTSPSDHIGFAPLPVRCITATAASWPPVQQRVTGDSQDRFRILLRRATKDLEDT
jgi:hypothetical protein